jgi:hypothetical protein
LVFKIEKLHNILANEKESVDVKITSLEDNLKSKSKQLQQRTEQVNKY